MPETPQIDSIVARLEVVLDLVLGLQREVALLREPTETKDEDDGDNLLTTAEAAAYLRISTRTLEKLKGEGEIKFVPVGRGPRPRVYFRREDLDAYLHRS